MTSTVFTSQRQRLVLNGFLDLLYLLGTNRVAMNLVQAARIRDAWDAIKLPDMQPLDLTAKLQSPESPLILPIGESGGLPRMSNIDQFSAQAQLNDIRRGKVL